MLLVHHLDDPVDHWVRASREPAYGKIANLDFALAIRHEYDISPVECWFHRLGDDHHSRVRSVGPETERLPRHETRSQDLKYC